jgi:hypothetical protein
MCNNYHPTSEGTPMFTALHQNTRTLTFLLHISRKLNNMIWMRKGSQQHFPYFLITISNRHILSSPLLYLLIVQKRMKCADVNSQKVPKPTAKGKRGEKIFRKE